MLYFVKSELRGAPPLPLEQWLDLLVKQFEIQASYQKEGKILAQGVYAGRKGCCCIYDVESNEVLHRLIGRLPAHAFLDWEVIPLFSHEQQLEVAKEHLASMRESKK